MLQWCEDKKIPVMAYSPVGQDSSGQKRIFTNAAVKEIAARHEATPAQVALAWLLRRPELIVIPKATQPQHIRENRVAHDIELTGKDLQELDKAFPPPSRKIALETN